MIKPIIETIKAYGTNAEYIVSEKIVGYKRIYLYGVSKKKKFKKKVVGRKK
ncbi:hypothetical protein ACFO26_06970 [Lactococcus nasutitermitis]|uniref:Uncharacterized protein n=1 Tax=Lactococcus nasutitermitis TaxID=1652957 RepID=A0ABV9JD02_9LACT|nr:hypothetical protein [Lactococcus nasutitermitis]